MSLAPPRLECLEPLRLAGLTRDHSREFDAPTIVAAIGWQWSTFLTRRGPLAAGTFLYGVTERMSDGDAVITYFCGTASPPADGLLSRAVPAMTVAVFPFRGPLTGFRRFVHSVFACDLKAAGLKTAPDAPGVPEFLERYPADFEPVSDARGFDLLIPVDA
jgi:hypothetical protein